MPLEYEDGGRLWDENIPPADVKAAYIRLMAAPADEAEVGDASVWKICDAYLKTVEDSGAKSTLASRENTLFDFCFGLPSRFVKRNGKVPPKPTRVTTFIRVKHHIEPRTISFKGVLQTLEAFQPLIATQGDHDRAQRQTLYQKLLDAVATHRVADRPDRFEPRQRKRRQKKYDRMMKPRSELKREMLKRVK